MKNELNLLTANTLSCFWRILPDAAPDEWDAAARAMAPVLPGGAQALKQGGWEGLVWHVLGERQFGLGRYCLSPFKRLYYMLRPVVPRRITIIARRFYRRQQESGFRLSWPIEDRYARFLYGALGHVLRKFGDYRQQVSLWPGGARFAFVLTHDVETADGQAFVPVLASLEERYGFYSSFNFVPEAYRIDRALLSDLTSRGFEVGVHGLRHDGKLFSSRAVFNRRAQKINEYLEEWNAVGFRSPLTHRNPGWMQSLEIEYDSSFFDTDPYETMPGGTMSIWPYFMGRFVELPYTLAQDHTLLVILKQESPKMWLDKVEFVARYGGMVLAVSHPDYLRKSARYLAVYEEFLREVESRGGYWHALPRDVARWWRARAEAKAERRDGRWSVPDLPGATIGRIGLSGQGIEITT